MSSPTSPSAVSQHDHVDPKSVAILGDLGITAQIARLALQQSKGDVEMAADLALSGKVDDEQVSKRAWWKNKIKGPPSSYKPTSPQSDEPSAASSATSRASSDVGQGGPSASQTTSRRPSAQSELTTAHEGIPVPTVVAPASADDDGDDEDDSFDGGKHSEISFETLLPPSPATPARPSTLGRQPSDSSATSLTSPTSPSESTGSARARPERLTPSTSSTKARARPTSPPNSSRPLSHQVLRSLPLGSMVPLGDQNKKDEPRSARKLNEQALKHDAEADSIVASLFGREASGSSFPASTSTHSATSESSRSRRLFGRKDRSQGASVVTSSNSTPAINTVPATPIDDRANPLVDEGRGRNNNSSRLSARSMSPFFRSGRSRSRARSPSPGSVGPLRGAQGTSEAADTSDEDEGESDAEGHLGPTSYGEVDDGESSFLDNSDVDSLDEETELNTEANAETSLIPGESGETPLSDLFQDIPTEFGEGPNIVLPPPEPFPVRSSSPSRTLPVDTGRPEYGRDRCTMKMTQGDPEGVSEKKGHRQRRYVVASDLSEESGYAVEWAIGTVARDGDEIWVVNVCEDEAKVDPKDASTQDRVEKIRNQKERQTLAQLLSRQVLSLLTRTNLNVDVVCQAVHTKNARHLLLDLIDFLDPTLVIVGSRGLGKLKGTILGSMSHYLVQKSSVPVMIARRRHRRNLKRTDPRILRQGARVPLARAGIEKTTGGKEQEDIVDAADIEAEEDDKDHEGEQRRKEALEAKEANTKTAA